MSKNKIPMQTQVSNMELRLKFSELNRLCSIELMLISQIIPLIFIVAKMKGAKHWPKGHYFIAKRHPALVNTALQKLTKVNPFYSNITIDNEWEDLNEQSDPVLWKLLTNKKAS